MLLLAFLALFAQQPSQWVQLGDSYQLTADPTVDPQGNVFFTDSRRNRILKIDLDGRITTWKEPSNNAHGIACGPDGRLYAGQHDYKRIVAFSPDGTESVITEGIQTHHLIVNHRNEIYFTVPPLHQVWLADRNGNKRVVLEGLNWPRSVAISPDRRTLAVNDPPSSLIWALRIHEDGSLSDRRLYCTLQTKPESSDPDPGGMTFDAQGALYIATNIGVQVCDKQGRLTSVIPPPGTQGLTNVRFAGPSLQWLYVTDGERFYRRSRQSLNLPHQK
ncbi:MAG: SMP-30/gluconolactonase/LRE family protein [Acidobacteria bacterium]|nr:SMP-30/gluconolactonase/LRE family protein [Acidobacteriota bacterium]